MTGRCHIAAFLLLLSSLSLAQGPSISATQSAIAYRQEIGRSLTVVCPASDGARASVYGTDTYTDDSSICAAAIHAGVLPPRQSGPVTLQIGPGAESYLATARNGVTSRSYGRWAYSFTFVRDQAPCAPSTAATAAFDTMAEVISREYAALVAAAGSDSARQAALLTQRDQLTREIDAFRTAAHAAACTDASAPLYVERALPAAAGRSVDLSVTPGNRRRSEPTVTAGSGDSPAPLPDAYGSSCASATALGVMPADSTLVRTGVIEESDRSDWFLLSLAPNSSVAVTLDGAGSSEYQLRTYRTCSGIPEFASSGPGAKTVTLAGPGSVLLQVSASRWIPGQTTYRLTTTSR